ncbi:hypothetical protein V1477_012613 [Vespula maculifrons]|uniref:Uncharacterized protein n=1 Tax=Vespula maculifrons TaxID=7453 RepID=A0ABD2BTJ7_VESMC
MAVFDIKTNTKRTKMERQILNKPQKFIGVLSFSIILIMFSSNYIRNRPIIQQKYLSLKNKTLNYHQKDSVITEILYQIQTV